MEFPFDLNPLFADRISALDHNLTPACNAWGRPDAQRQVAMVIDELGRASAKAQKLATPITSAAKMQSNHHRLYLLKIGESNGGRGVAVGFLKVGYKKLFLLDQQGAHIETEPLCVLDFYISESLQRHGYGQQVFNYMLQHERAEPQLMAYDRPSPKFLSFLKKHYGLERCVPQVNNFVVFDGFFREKSAVQVRKLPPRKPEGEIKPYSLTEREALKEEQRGLPWPFNQAPPPSSPLGRSLSVGCSPSHGPPPRALPALSALRVDRPRPPQLNGAASGPPRTRRTSQQGLVARGNLYSRHISSGTLRPSPEKRPAPPRQPGEPETDQDRPDWARTPIRDCAADTQDRRPQCSAQPPVPPLSLPRPPSCEMESSLDQTPLTPLAPRPDCPPHSGGPRDGEASKAPDAGRDPPRAPPSPPRSWTTVVQPFTAQWVRRKQEYRSTRPW